MKPVREFATYIFAVVTAFAACNKSGPFRNASSAPSYPPGFVHYPVLPSTATHGDSVYIKIGSPSMVEFGKLSLARCGVLTAAAGSKILFAGGIADDVTTRVDIYDTLTHAWSTAELSKARYTMTTATFGNKIFFAGGQEGDPWFSYSTRIDIYDASTNSWSIAELSQPRSAIAATVLGSKIYFAGGETNTSVGGYLVDEWTTRVDVYDTQTNTWSIAELSEARGGLSACSLGNKIYFAGGQNLETISDRVDIYDASNNTWSTSALSEPKVGMANIAIGGKIYWAGGLKSLNGYLHSDKVDIFDAAAQHIQIDALSEARSDFSAVSLNNKILLFTGDGGDSTFDILDVTTNTWSAGRLNQSLRAPGVIASGKQIYIAGGMLHDTLTDKVWQFQF